MNLNPYEAPTTADPRITTSKNRFFEYCGPFEMLILAGYVLLILAAAGYRLN